MLHIPKEKTFKSQTKKKFFSIIFTGRKTGDQGARWFQGQSSQWVVVQRPGKLLCEAKNKAFLFCLYSVLSPVRRSTFHTSVLLRHWACHSGLPDPPGGLSLDQLITFHTDLTINIGSLNYDYDFPPESESQSPRPKDILTAIFKIGLGCIFVSCIIVPLVFDFSQTIIISHYYTFSLKSWPPNSPPEQLPFARWFLPPELWGNMKLPFSF